MNGVRVSAVCDISLTVGGGELVAIMGPSGSGKSTLLSIAGGLQQPTAGEVIVDGFRIRTMSLREMAALRRSFIGYVFQDLNLIPAFTAAENIALPRELDGVRPRRARIEALEVLDRLGLSELADRYPDTLSGGQQQRVAIGRAVVGGRGLLLADEPTGALDSTAGRDVLQLLRDVCDDGAAVVLVTHDPDHLKVADRVVLLHDGRVVGQRRRDADVSAITDAP